MNAAERCEICGSLNPQFAHGKGKAAAFNERALVYEGVREKEMVYTPSPLCMACRHASKRPRKDNRLGIVWSARDSRAVFK